jgi:hypothetical protein
VSEVGKVPEEILMFMYETLDATFISQGNKTYQSLSMFEPIMLALMLDKHDSLRKASDFLGWVKNAMQEPHFHAMNTLLKRLEDSDISCEALCELRGLFRHWGHPTVHEELGCEKTRIIGQTSSYPTVSSQRKMVGLLKRQFYISFLNRHGRPPQIRNLSFFKGKPIYDLLITGSKTLNLYSPAYTLEDWGFIRFDKEFEFDYHIDYTELMDHKALSPLRSEMRTAFNPDRLGYSPGRASTSRRVLEEVLNRETINVRRICELVQLRLIPQDWLIIMIHAKERELKEAPRMFAMMVFEMRAYFCVTESNIAKIIFSYFPQQTMTLDEAELAKRLLFLSDIFKDPAKFLGIFNIIDFSSWNLGHTRLLTEPFFEMLDDLIGTPGLFANTHWFFEQCVIVMASYLNPPSTLLTSQRGDPPPCNELWYGHARESLQDFATAIQQLARGAYPPSPEEHIRKEAGKAFVEGIKDYEIKIRLLLGGEKTLSEALEVHAVLIAARSERSNNGVSSWTRSPPIKRRDAKGSGSWDYKKSDNFWSRHHYGRATADDRYQHRDERPPRDTQEPPKTPERRPRNVRETGTRNGQPSGNGRRPAEKGERRQVH